MNRRAIEIKVHPKVPQNTVHSLVEFIAHRQPTMWGQESPSTTHAHIQDMIYLWLYKDIEGIGYQNLAKIIRFPYKITHKSLRHNIQLIRALAALWALEYIHVGMPEEWNQAASQCHLNVQLRDTNLWMDSTDFPISGKCSMSKKNPYFSYKLKGPGQRFMAVFDGKGKIRKLWGGYSPKQHDGMFLKEHKQELSHDFEGGVIVADNHFSCGKKFLFQLLLTFCSNKSN